MANKINDWYDLDDVRNDLSGDYVLVNYLDSSTAGYDDVASDTANGGSGFDPIGFGEDNQFTGSFYGQNYTISNLYIDRGSSDDFVGLFGAPSDDSIIENVGVVNVDITGSVNTGGLAGNNRGSISKCYVSGGSIVGGSYVGGLVGYSSSGSVSNSYSAVTVSGGSYVGGLVGWNTVSVSKSYSTGSVSGDSDVGGLVGITKYGSVSNSFWDTETSGLSSSDGGTGKTTAEMQEIATYTDTSTEGLSDPWDFVGNPNDDIGDNDYWNIEVGVNDGYPYLRELESEIPLRREVPDNRAEVSDRNSQENNRSTQENNRTVIE